MSTEENTPNNKIITIDTLKHYHDEMVENTLTWNNVANKPSAFTPDNHGSDKVTAMTSYSKPSTITDENLPISTNDSLNSAVGKLEYKADNALVLAGNNSDRLDDVDARNLPKGEILWLSPKGCTTESIAQENGVIDVSGNGNHGKANGGVAIVNDNVLGQCYSFDGVDDYVILNKPSTFDDSEFSICAKIKVGETITTNTSREIFLTYTDSSNRLDVQIRDKKIAIRLPSGTYADTDVYPDNGDTIECVLTVKVDAEDNTKSDVKLFVNGIKKISITITKYYNWNKIGFGAYNQSGLYNKFTGLISDFRIYPYALTDKQVMALYQYGQQPQDNKAIQQAPLTDYSLPSSTPDPINIQTTDSLKTALGKLEYKANNALVNIGEVDTKVDNIKVGGRNLLLNSNNNGNGWNNSDHPHCDIYLGDLKPSTNDVVTISIKADVDWEKVNYLAIYNSGNDLQITIMVSQRDLNGVIIASFPWKVETSSNTFIRIFSNIKSGQTRPTIKIDWVKLEFGNQATTYTPAPEDTELAKLRSYSKPSSTSAIATTDTIKSAIGKLEVKVDNAVSKADTLESTYLPLSGGTMTGDLETQDVLPKTDVTYDLGSSSKYYANSYITTTYTNAIIEKTTDAGITFTGDILPNTTETYDLGSSTKQFDNLYAKKIYQNGTALATVATSGSYADLSNIPSTFTPASHTHVSNDITSLDASKLTGTISLDRLPHGALEQLVKVANETARFALTTEEVQNGDTVQQLDTGVMYIVVDQTKLSQAAGYVEYTAGSATSVPWSGVTNKPSFGNTAGTFCEGNDSRLSDARTPTEHTHPYLPLAGGEMEGNITPKLSGSNLTLGELNRGWNYVYASNIKGTSANGLVLDSNMTPSSNLISVGTSSKPFGNAYISNVHTSSVSITPTSGLNYSQIDPNLVTVHAADSTNEATSYLRAFGCSMSSYSNGNCNFELNLGTSSMSSSNPRLEMKSYDSNGDLYVTGKFSVDNVAPSIEFSHGSNTSAIYYDFLTPGSEGFSVSGHWNPFSNNAVDLGSTSFKWKSFYTYEVNMYSSGTQNIQMAMSSDSTPVPQILFTNGSNAVALQALAASSASAILTLKGSFRPEANNTRSLGSDSFRWKSLDCTTIASGTVRPFSNASGSLGTSSYYYSTAYVNNIVTNLSTSAIRPSVTQNGSVGTATYEWLSMYSKDIYQGGQRVLDESSIEEITNSEIDALFDAASISGNSEYSVATTSDLTSIFHDA